MVALLQILAGCASPPNVGKGMATEGDKMQVGHLISVRIQGVPEPPSFEGQIDEDGNIQILYLGKVKAAGFTPNEFADKLKYEFVQKGVYPPRVIGDMIVTVVDASRYYYITGEAQRGRYPLTGPLTVCKALLGGSTGEFANLKKVVVHRGSQKIRCNCIRANQGDARYDIEIKSGDVIEVPKKGILPFL